MSIQSLLSSKGLAISNSNIKYTIEMLQYSLFPPKLIIIKQKSTTTGLQLKYNKQILFIRHKKHMKFLWIYCCGAGSLGNIAFMFSFKRRDGVPKA